MQKTILKAGESERFYIALASIDKEKNGRYEAILTLLDKKYPRNKKGTNQIRVIGDNKSIVVKQVKEIAKLYSPIEDIWFLDVEEVKKTL